MLQKLEDVERRYIELEGLLIDPDVLANRKDFARLAKERAGLEELVTTYRAWKRLKKELDDRCQAGGCRLASTPPNGVRGGARALALVSRTSGSRRTASA